MKGQMFIQFVILHP